jgi:hypothetical protein
MQWVGEWVVARQVASLQKFVLSKNDDDALGLGASCGANILTLIQTSQKKFMSVTRA